MALDSIGIQTRFYWDYFGADGGWYGRRIRAVSESPIGTGIKILLPNWDRVEEQFPRYLGHAHSKKRSKHFSLSCSRLSIPFDV